jgi:hypothetical protein
MNNERSSFMLNIFKLNLRMFDGMASAGASTGAPAAGEGTTGEQQNTTSTPGKNKGAAQKVLYGIQDTPESNGTNITTQAATEKETTTQQDPEAKKAAFEKLIQGEYKDLYTEKTQTMIDKRFKETKSLQKQADVLKSIVDIFGPKYNITDGDTSKLLKAIQEDASLFEEEALSKGLTVEQLQYQKRIERENTLLRQQQVEAEEQRQRQERISNWEKQSKEIKNVYPEFDWRKEMGDEKTGEDFFKILNATDNLTYAYNATHFDQILPNAMYLAAQKANEATAKNIQSRSNRPAENGMASQSGVVIKSNVDNLTRADIIAGAERSKRGEKIRFS